MSWIDLFRCGAATATVSLVLCPSLAPAQLPAVRGRQQVPLPGRSGPQVQPQGQGQPLPPNAAVQQQPPGAPFILTPGQQAALNQVLDAWERRGKSVKTMKVPFTRYDYDDTWQKQTKSEGLLQFAAPDKGLYRIDQSDGGLTDHWVCNGQSIFEFNAANKQLIERPIPVEMRGQAIGDGPLPFLFGATANKLKQRYFMRITTTPEEHARGEIWIEAFPRFQRDAANFYRAVIILKAQDPLSVHALEVVLPNRKQRTVHSFGQEKINDPFRFLERDFARPAAPFGWDHVIQRPEAAPAAPPRSAGLQGPQPARPGGVR